MSSTRPTTTRFAAHRRIAVPATLGLVAAVALVLDCSHPGPAAPVPVPARPEAAAAAPPRSAPAAPATSEPTAEPAPLVCHFPIGHPASLGPVRAGLRTRARLSVSLLTSHDPLRLSFDLLAVDDPPGRDWKGGPYDWSRSWLRIELTTPGGTTHTLEVAPPLAGLEQLVGHGDAEVILDGQGMTINALKPPVRRLSWRTPRPGLLAAPGRYGLTLTGEVRTARRTLSIASPAIAFEVAPPGTMLPLSEIERRAASIAAAHFQLSAPPTPVLPTTDDAKGVRTVSFIVNLASGAEKGEPKEGDRTYQVRSVEVLFDPQGRHLETR